MSETKIKEKNNNEEQETVVEEQTKVKEKAPDFGDDYVTEVSSENDMTNAKEFDLGMLNRKQRRELKKRIGVPRYTDQVKSTTKTMRRKRRNKKR